MSRLTLSVARATTEPVRAALGPLFDHTRDAVAVGDVQNGRIVLWNPAAERLLGWPAREAVGQPIATLISSAVVPLYQASADLTRRGEPARPFEMPLTRRDGTAVAVEVVLLPLEYQPAPDRYMMLLGQEHPHDRCHAASTRPGDAAVASMLQVAAELTWRRINLAPLVTQVVARARAQTPHHILKTAVPQGLTMTVDPERIEELVTRLIQHAVKRCPRGCWIDVSLQRPLGGLARLEVRDFGQPVDAQSRQRPGVDDDPDVAVARAIVEQHGGTLFLELPDDGGVRAVVTLPTQRGRLTR